MSKLIENLGVVYWEFKDKSKSGNGKPINIDSAYASVKQSSIDYPKINHWVENVPIMSAIK